MIDLSVQPIAVSRWEQVQDQVVVFFGELNERIQVVANRHFNVFVTLCCLLVGTAFYFQGAPLAIGIAAISGWVAASANSASPEEIANEPTSTCKRALLNSRRQEPIVKAGVPVKHAEVTSQKKEVTAKQVLPIAESSSLGTLSRWTGRLATLTGAAIAAQFPRFIELYSATWTGGELKGYSFDQRSRDFLFNWADRYGCALPECERRSPTFKQAEENPSLLYEPSVKCYDGLLNKDGFTEIMSLYSPGTECHTALQNNKHVETRVHLECSLDHIEKWHSETQAKNAFESASAIQRPVLLIRHFDQERMKTCWRKFQIGGPPINWETAGYVFAGGTIGYGLYWVMSTGLGGLSRRIRGLCWNKITK